jgi:hypothetical protein
VLAPRLASDVDEKLILIQLSYIALLCYFNLFMGNSFQYILSKKLIPNMSSVSLRYIWIPPPPPREKSDFRWFEAVENKEETAKHKLFLTVIGC